MKVGHITLHTCYLFMAFIATNIYLRHRIKVTRSPHSTMQYMNATVSSVRECPHMRCSKVETRFAEISECKSRDGQIPGAKCPWQPNFVGWCLLFVSPHQGISFMSSFCCLENLGCDV